MEYQFQPSTFAEKIIELESSLEYNGSIDLIWALNDLYRTGIDYYMEKQPKKAKFIQKKMTSLLANPDNLRILERESNHKSRCGSEQVDKIRNKFDVVHSGLNTSKLNEELNKFRTVADTCILNIVQSSQKAAMKTSQLKNQDLNRQQQKLEGRIALKRAKSQEKFNNVLSQKNIPHSENKFQTNLSRLIE